MKVLSFRKMVLMAMILITRILMAKSEIHYIGGGKSNWAPNINFSEWSSHKQFYVGDWLYFGFDINIYNVLEVNKISYENCIETGFIKNITKGGRDVFELKEAKPYYFLSGGGHCWQGMKVAINVEAVQPTPAPAPPKSASASYFCGIQDHPLLMVISALVWSLLFK